ncbi:Penicillin-binding protein [Flavobacterium sp. 9AF]|uniref:serine hydrolase domain-containing protein n=1 Tax=Flavobacterium sp. 9AF TaxID=2653142 RepID=UPI0012F417E2|nr:serine hydrolase domain-containing protein [Flavobacterium sp. 9AF]VXB75441.1 Penicillin-binding protein [Flavobacterium sp. 9AF]
MKISKFYPREIKYVFLFFVCITFLISCQNQGNKKQDLETTKISKTSFSFPKFNSLEKKYIQEKRKEIAHFYTKNIDVDHFSGSFLVAKNGKVLFEKYTGYSNFKNKTKINSSSAIHLASISKVMTATVILRLIDAKKTTLETKIKEYFPEFPYSNITIETLLNHRSGLPNYLHFSDIDSIWDKSKMIHNEDILNLIISKKVGLDFEPNTKFSYNNTNYAILALVIEKITQLSFPKAMKTYLFEPLQMNNTFVFEIDKHEDTVGKNYKSTWEEIPCNYQDAVYGDKNIYSTPRDILKLDLATYSDDFLSKDIKSKAYKGYSYEKKGVNNYGLGIRLREWDDGKTMFYHNGWWHGNKTSYITLKKDTVTMIALSNKYTSKVYQIKRLSSLFGDYPFTIEDEE